MKAEEFAADALLAYWDGDGEETAPRALARGREEIRRALALADGRSETLVTVADERNRLIEARVVDSGGVAVATLAASLQLDAAGAVTRALVYRTSPIEASPTWTGGQADAPACAREVLDTYFGHLEAGRFAAAADCFSADCLYSHPPYAPGAGRVEFRGRAELLAGFTERGKRPWEHRVAVALQQGGECLLEGTATGTALGGSFISSLSLDAEGRICRYAAFYCEPPVERRRLA